MSGLMLSGLEVTPNTGPEVQAQPDANKYFIKAEEPEDYPLARPIQSGLSDPRSPNWRKAFWALALIAVLCLAVAIGAGLGVGLAARHRSASPSGSAASKPTDSIPMASSAVATTVRSGEAVTMISVPLTSPITQTDKVVTIISTPSDSPTVPSPVCPADDRSTFIATNKPSPTASPGLEITNASLAYEILCYTNFIDDPTVMDLQTLTNVTSLHDCLVACALYSFQTRPADFPAFACTGIAWSRVAGETQLCWLKNNVTSTSVNATVKYPGMDGAIMMFG